jgi:superfamily II DNA or RNA helicase
VKVSFGNIHARVTGASKAEQQELLRLLTCWAPGFQYHRAYHKFKRTHGREGWDGKSCLVEKFTFPTGLLPHVSKHIPLELTDKRYIRNVNLCSTHVPLRDYQWDTAKTSLGSSFAGIWWPRGVIKIATGGGKTEIAWAMIEMAPVNTIIITPSVQLTDQFMERLDHYNIDTSNVRATTVQALMWHATKTTVPKDRDLYDNYLRTIENKRARAKEMEAYLATVEQVFVDEAHLIIEDDKKRQMFISALKCMPNAYMRWGLTATPFMREPLYNLVLEGAIGEKLTDISNRDLISMGYLVDAEVDFYKVPPLDHMPEEWHDQYEVGIIHNAGRNELIKKAVHNAKGPTLVLVKSIDHGTILSSSLSTNKDRPLTFIHGKTPRAARHDAARDLANQKQKTIIASGVWYQGIDIPPIETIINAAGGESIIQQLQKLGRGLRLSDKTGKKMLKIVDFKDLTGEYLQNHYLSRNRVYKGEGFKVKEL